MNNILKQIEIDLYSPTSYEVIKAQQGDNNSRIIEFVLYNQGKPYAISNDILIKLEGHRGDNSYFPPKDCTVSNNVITAVLDRDILYESGTVEAKIVMYNISDDTILSTIPFRIHVQKNPCDKNKIESEKHSIIDWLFLNFEKLKNSFENISLNVTQHISDNIRHITSTERNNWNDSYNEKHTHNNKSILDKINQILLDNWNTAYTHISDNIKHITSSERTLWNTVGNKVDKIEGKGLSSNDFTTEEKNIIASLSSGAVTGVKGNAESSFHTGNVNITPANIGLGNVNNTADVDKNVFTAKRLKVEVDNYKQGTDLPSTYPQGEVIFFSNNPNNRFNGIQYCTIHTIKGYTNVACIQFLYPYNTNHDKFYFREALYSTDAWRDWREVITSANIGSQSVNYATSAGSATKAAQDGDGNVIKDNYAIRKVVTGGDFNDMTTPGLYTMKNTSTNRPSGSGTYHGLLVLKSDNGDYVEQLAIREGTGHVYVRYRIGDSWGQWTRLLSENDKSELLAYVNLSSYINVNSQYFSLTSAYSENGVVVIYGQIKAGFNGSNKLFTVTSDSYAPRTKILGSFGYSGQSDDGKIQNIFMNENREATAWTNQALNYAVNMSFVYPGRI